MREHTPSVGMQRPFCFSFLFCVGGKLVLFLEHYFELSFNGHVKLFNCSNEGSHVKFVLKSHVKIVKREWERDPKLKN
jgi:hypothetical protein